MSFAKNSNIARFLTFSVCLLALFFAGSENAAAQCKKKNADKFIARGNEFYARKDYRNALIQFNEAVKTDSQCAAAHFNVGQAQRYLEQYDNAIQSINRALALRLAANDDRVTAYNALGSIYLKKDGERWMSEAIWHGEEAVKIDPTSADGWQIIAVANMNLKKHDESIRALTELIRLKPENLDYREARGSALTNLKKYREALADFYHIAQKEPQNFLYQVYVGELYLMLGNFKQASEALNKAASLKPDSPLPYSGLGSSYLGTKQYEKAAESFQKAAQFKTHAMAEAVSGEGFARLAIGQYREAVNLLHKSLQYQPVIQKPDDFRAMIYGGLGNAYTQLAEYQKAIEFLRKAKELSFEDKYADENLSWSYSMLGENEAAIEASNRAIARKPKDETSYINRCRAKMELKLWNDALADCEKALELKPDNGEALFYYSRILKNKKRNKEAIAANKKAIASLEKALNVKPGAASSGNFRQFFGNEPSELELQNETPGLINLEVNIQTPYTPYILGNAYAEDNQPNKAVLAYQEVLRRSPNFPLARYNLGITYYITGKKKLALEQYEALVKVDQKRAADLKKIIDGK